MEREIEIKERWERPDNKGISPLIAGCFAEKGKEKNKCRRVARERDREKN